MTYKSIKTRKKLYELARPLGLNSKEIDDILNQTRLINEQTSFSAGPRGYTGGWYGTISIYVFD